MESINVMVFLQIILILVLFMHVVTNSKTTHNQRVVIDKESKKEMENLNKLRNIKLSEPLTEKSRPKEFREVIGQEKGIMALKAAICGPNPQHVIIYGPPGVGKTAAARLVLEYAKTKGNTPFKDDAKFVEVDATTIRFDERGIADPLIGSVHDPIYQGAGSMGIAGIPQPKPGAVTKAHGGILFLDEIGELHSTELNKLLKVLEDRKVFLDSSYYSSEDPNMPVYIKEVFDNGLPADFRLIGATTRSPEEIAPAIRSRCVEIFFRALDEEEIQVIAQNAINKINLTIDKESLNKISRYCTNGREVVNIVQLCSGLAINEDRKNVTVKDVMWVIENGQYTERGDKTIYDKPQVGIVNGLAVYGSNLGTLMEIEATARKVDKEKGNVKITGIVEEEEISSNNRKIRRKSNAHCSVQNVLSILENIFKIDCSSYHIHVNFPGGTPVDGPSAGISITCAVYSAINGIPIDNKVAMTGEVSLIGKVKPIGGVSAKILAAKKAGATTVIIPKDNYDESLEKIEGVKIVPVENIKEVLEVALFKDYSQKKDENVSIEVLYAEGNESF
ncbi:ATP-dependent protease LonB [Clostridium intestinale]|uniref:endopeptidase La n=2 Tax=Clostridium intestinale TaxID=36845 RepID=U2Q0T8_9CLOT|nr:ATP-dependent protease LonB [Clostridium intestinale]ERK29639.1 ATP-dependent protease LonB [Clostridium intestinale URNW]QLY81138.1 ATP-dependent protease LonB [Clostridium intestinale]